MTAGTPKKKQAQAQEQEQEQEQAPVEMPLEELLVAPAIIPVARGPMLPPGQELSATN